MDFNDAVAFAILIPSSPQMFLFLSVANMWMAQEKGILLHPQLILYSIKLAIVGPIVEIQCLLCGWEETKPKSVFPGVGEGDFDKMQDLCQKAECHLNFVDIWQIG